MCSKEHVSDSGSQYSYSILHTVQEPLRIHCYESIPEATVAEDEECEGKEEMFEAGRPGLASIGMDSTPHNTCRVCVFG